MIEPVKLSEWARANGGQTATRWLHAGVVPVPACQFATATIRVDEAIPPAAGVAIYARVSSGDHRGDLDRQVSRLTAVATERRLPPTRVVVEEAEVADGLVRDMVEVLTSVCARLYGRRSARRRAEAVLVATKSQAVA